MADNTKLVKLFRSNFTKRALSTIILAPIALFAVHTGGILYNILVAVILFLFACEWLLIVYKSQNMDYKIKCLWVLYCALFIFITSIAATSLRHTIVPEEGQRFMIWLITIVWVTDISAYFVGTGLGGPKIAPKISPSKTWSGFVGALLFSILAHNIFMLYFINLKTVTKFQFEAMWFATLCTSVIAQIGDLLESAFKRHFKVKDSGKLIPGHGGIMDRVDGLLIAILFWFTICHLFK